MTTLQFIHDCKFCNKRFECPGIQAQKYKTQITMHYKYAHKSPFDESIYTTINTRETNRFLNQTMYANSTIEGLVPENKKQITKHPITTRCVGSLAARAPGA